MTAGTPATYPLVLRGDLDKPIHRWLFLVKWLLLLPHLIILALLSIALAVSLVICFFAILFTASYPRGLFGFNVGVLRWWWRVSFYGYAALGTDRYPPFSLDRDPVYPADLTMEYSQQLNRWLVLVKWLLAVPHLLVVTIFNGGYGKWGGGLVWLLTVIAGFANLFAGEYPETIFRLVMGLNRWSFRVAAYTLLMADKYPPFSLD